MFCSRTWQTKPISFTKHETVFARPDCSIVTVRVQNTESSTSSRRQRGCLRLSSATKTPPKTTGKRKSSESDDSRDSTPDRNVKQVMFPLPPPSPATSAQQQPNLPDEILPNPVHPGSSGQNWMMAAYTNAIAPEQYAEIWDSCWDCSLERERDYSLLSLSREGLLSLSRESSSVYSDWHRNLVSSSDRPEIHQEEPDAGLPMAESPESDASLPPPRPSFYILLEAVSHLCFSSTQAEQEWGQYNPQQY